MATASSTLLVNPYPTGVDNTQRRVVVYGTCVLSADNYVTGGIPLGWTRMRKASTNTPFTPPQVGPISVAAPKWAEFESVGNETTQPGYVYTYNVPTTGSTTLRISSGGTELTNGAAITADNIVFKAEWVRGQF